MCMLFVICLLAATIWLSITYNEEYSEWEKLYWEGGEPVMVDGMQIMIKRVDGKTIVGRDE